MTNEELNKKLAFLFDGKEAVSLTMYFVTENDGGEVDVKKAKISDDARNALFDQFKGSLDEKLYSNQELLLVDISKVDEKLKATYYYDLDEKVAGLEVLSTVLNNPPDEEFDFTDDNLRDIYAIILCLGNEKEKVAIYKKQAPFKILRRRSASGRVVRLIPFDTQLIELETDVVEIGSTFDFVQYKDDLFIIRLETLEKHFEFDKVIQNIAAETVRQIGTLNFIADTNALERFLTNKTLARKLMRLRRDAPVFDLEFEVVKNFLKGEEKLKDMFKFNADETRIELNSKVAVENFIKLLDDDFVMSQLTKIYYDAERKEVLIGSNGTETAAAA
ncbi:MAG: anti-phage protein KwaB [Pyrinomonadaceae bacterium]